MENKINSSGAIEGLIIRGVNLMRLIDPAIDEYSDSNVDMVYVRQKYNIWRIDIKDEIQRNKINQVAASYFWQPDGIPLIDGGIEYSDAKSERSQKMLKKIYKQIRIKNDKLTKLAKLISGNMENGIEERIILQKSKHRKIHLHKFPADLKWEEVSIKFLNGDEVIITAKDERLQTNYEEMGFQDEKKKQPNKQWKFLTLLSIKNGEISWNNNQDLPLKQINSIKKQKQLLSNILKNYFQIEENPFWDYRKEKAYRIKINLTPEASFIMNKKEEDTDDDDSDIEEYRKKQAPEIYEE